MSLDERVTLLEAHFEETADLLERLLTVVEANQKQLIEQSKVSRLYSKGLEPKRVLKDPGDREI
jgi:hypothetical protein